MVKPIVKRVDTRGLQGAVRRLVKVSRRTINEELIRHGRGLVKRLFDITPPASAGKTGRAAQVQGEQAISRDLLGGRKRAGIFTVMDRGMLARFESIASKDKPEIIRLFVTKSGRVYGADRAMYKPDATVDEMRAHHLQYFVSGKMSQAGGRTRDVGRWRFIDKMIVSAGTLAAYAKFIFGHVGMLASGLVPLAAALGFTRVAAWVKRHDGSGRGQVRQMPDGGPSPTIRAVFSGQTAILASELQRRVFYAVNYQLKAIARETGHLLRKRAGETMRHRGMSEAPAEGAGVDAQDEGGDAEV